MFLDESVNENGSWNVYKCQVCNHVYLGSEKPDNCPFCGSDKEAVLPSDQWEEIKNLNLNDQMKEYLELALKMEMEDTERYEAMMEECEERNESKNTHLLDGLAHHEEEHAELIEELLEKLNDDIKEPEEVDYDGPFEMKEFIEYSLKKEDEAIELYRKIQMNTNNPDIEYVFKNLIEAELEHKKLLNSMS